MKSRNEAPPPVTRACVTGDTQMLRFFGKRGVEAKKKKKKVKITFWLAGAYEAMVQAHEDTCPLPD